MEMASPQIKVRLPLRSSSYTERDRYLQPPSEKAIRSRQTNWITKIGCGLCVCAVEMRDLPADVVGQARGVPGIAVCGAAEAMPGDEDSQLAVS